MKLKTLLAAAIIFCLSSSAVSADSGLTISPTTIELMMAPNKKVVQNITIKNHDIEATYEFSLHTLIPLGENGENTILKEELDVSSVPYVIKINNKSVKDFTLNLEAQEETTLTLQIDSATTDTSSSNNLILAIEPQDASTLTSHGVIGIPLLLTLASTSTLDIDIELLGFTLPIIHDSQSPIKLDLKLKNNSSFMHRPGGNLEIQAHKERINLEIIPNLILGQTIRTIQFQEKGDSILEPKFQRIGPHTFTINITTPGGKTIITKERTILFLPIRSMLVAIILVITIGILVWRRNKSKLVVDRS